MNDEARKQEFLGTALGGAVIKAGAKIAVEKVLNRAAKSSDMSLAQKDVQPIKRAIEVEAEREIDARVEHITDTEPHRSSRNVWGALVGIVTAVEIMRVLWMDGKVNTVTDYLIPAGAIITALTPLYSRFIAKKPLGR